MRIAQGFRTDVGRGRPENEDSILVDAAHGLYAVADGMGGHRAGEVASATAIETLQDSYLGGRPIDRAIEEANAAVFARAAEDAALRGMGTTLTAVAVDGGTALLGHVGDSRAYLLREGPVTQVTDDHSLVEQLVREGRLTPEEAQNHPQRAIITRALGVDAEVQVDTYRVDLRPGDRLLLCSDGLTTMLPDETIGATLRRHADPQQAADTLVDMANQAGGDDNITVLILDALADGAADGRPAAAAASRTGEPTGEWELDEAPPESGPGAAPPMAAEPHPEPDPDLEPAPADGPGRSLWGVARWALPVLAVIGVAVGAVGWYARRTYYVGFSADRVALFKGVPGGLLGWNPTIDRQTDLTAGELTPADRADLESGHRFASRSEANRFIARLEQDRAALAATTTTTAGALPPPPPPLPPDGTAPTGATGVTEPSR
ncbi:MAG TPA: Stp1/IreP family PP2C-type Ser/Thr phosphatase [Acidimicrobiia bacterium]|nr:Stp1/IreP family PP2C-type Ser/Thr phosphatase [Acidimicrobiia bacterium]